MFSEIRVSPLVKLENIAQHFPFWVATYFLTIVALRLLLSSNLDIDDAQIVGATDFLLYYGNSHPPLYNWLFRCILEITGWNWAFTATVLKYSLLYGIFFLAWKTAKHITNNAVLAMLVSCCFILFPQIIWESQARLTHSVLVAFASVATIHAVVRINLFGKWYDFLWLGIALSAGTLAKFNFFIFLASLILSIFLTASIRSSFLNKKLLITVGAYILFCVPSLLFVLMNFDSSSNRISKMYQGEGNTLNFDIPYIGLNGFIDLIINIVAWTLPLILTAVILYLFKALPELSERKKLTQDYELYISFFKRLTLGSLAIFSIIILIMDMENIQARYITPLLMPLPFWLVLEYPIIANKNATLASLRSIGVIAIIIAIGLNVMYLMPSHIFSVPYKEFARGITNKYGSDIKFGHSDYRHIANLQLYIDGRVDPYADKNASEYIAIWTNRDSAKKPSIGYIAVGEIYTQRYYHYFTSKQSVMHSQLYRKINHNKLLKNESK